tara:strand:- start:18152 stop:18589 length:438 start_codon:yes stop_codon:yes gene_type:complete
MLALLQRVLSAEVEVDNQIIAKIDRGILVFLGIEKYDTEEQVDKIIKKIVNYRIFPDSDDKMNLSLLDSNLELLLVPQFTLAANTKKGNRPSFTNAKLPSESLELFNLALDKASNYNIKIQSGKFQADMQVKLINNGPATFMLSC